jgi:16S rRNA (guanine1207-N2)-methyltransferase
MFDLAALYACIQGKVRPPVAIVLGSPQQAATLVSLCPESEVVAYQMDLHQAGRLKEELDSVGRTASIATKPDLWDLPADFQTVLFPVPKHGERELKLDLLDQAQHILKPSGQLIALSEYRRDDLMPKAIKKVFGKCSETPSAREGSIFWAALEKDKPRRRHEVTFHARIGEGPSHSFVSRPGVFSYGRMDDGARALLEVAAIEAGNSILDLGCGVGTNGIIASDRAGSGASITFLDSNVRAITLTESNAAANGLTNFTCHASSTMQGLPPASFDVILANPPYFAASAIAKMFIDGSKPLLKEGGRLYLVTKQVEHVAPLMVEVFGEVDAYETRGYSVIEAVAGRSE